MPGEPMPAGILVRCHGSGTDGHLYEDMTMVCPVCGQEVESDCSDDLVSVVVPEHQRAREDRPRG